MYSCYLEPDGLVPGPARRSPWNCTSSLHCKFIFLFYLQCKLQGASLHLPAQSQSLCFSVVRNFCHTHYTSRHQIPLQCSALCFFILFSAVLLHLSLPHRHSLYYITPLPFSTLHLLILYTSGCFFSLPTSQFLTLLLVSLFIPLLHPALPFSLRHSTSLCLTLHT